VDEEEDDLYLILGLAPNASMKEIRTAYRQLALRYHPDKQNSDMTEEEKQRAARKFTQLAAAYEILSDPVERQTYDNTRRRRNAAHHRTPHSHVHPFDDFVHHSGFHFHDPFAVFEQVFQNMQRDHDSFFSSSSSLFGNRGNRDPFDASPFMMDPFGSRSSFFGGGMMSDMMMRMDRDPFMSMPMMMGNPTNSSSFTTSTITSSSFFGGAGNMGESVTTTSRTINGQTVTERTIRRSDGTVHTERITSSSSSAPNDTLTAATSPSQHRRSLLPSFRRLSGSHNQPYVVDLVDDPDSPTAKTTTKHADPLFKKRRKK
jgi:curved DNA-binding protein CbpA